MFQMEIIISDDKKTVAITLPNMTAPQEIDADELSEMLRHLAWIRSAMVPAHEPVDLKPETRISKVPAIRWQPTQDDLPGQCRLFLLHPGFGWLYIPLNQTAFDKMSEGCRMFLQATPLIQ